MGPSNPSSRHLGKGAIWSSVCIGSVTDVGVLIRLNVDFPIIGVPT